MPELLFHTNAHEPLSPESTLRGADARGVMTSYWRRAFDGGRFQDLDGFMAFMGRQLNLQVAGPLTPESFVHACVSQRLWTAVTPEQLRAQSEVSALPIMRRRL